MSTQPGVTSRPVASISSVPAGTAASTSVPTATTRPSTMATSPTKAGAPVPSTMVPLRTTRSAMPCSCAPAVPLTATGSWSRRPHRTDEPLHCAKGSAEGRGDPTGGRPQRRADLDDGRRRQRLLERDQVEAEHHLAGGIEDRRPDAADRVHPGVVELGQEELLGPVAG